jgi:hypothetical protein
MEDKTVMKISHPALKIFKCWIPQFCIFKPANQFELVLQNKPNLLDTQMDVSTFKTKDYKNEKPCRRGVNKPNQTQFLKIPDNFSSKFLVGKKHWSSWRILPIILEFNQLCRGNSCD